jgi:hypothetical protein
MDRFVLDRSAQIGGQREGPGPRRRPSTQREKELEYAELARS